MQPTIYKNGPYRVIPITVALAVVASDGTVIARYSVADVDQAVNECDTLAESAGYLEHVA